MAEDDPDPYRVLVEQAAADRAELDEQAAAGASDGDLDALRADRMQTAVFGCLDAVYETARRAARFYDRDCADDLLQRALTTRLRWHAIRVYEGRNEVPRNWPGMVRSNVKGTFLDQWEATTRDREVTDYGSFEQAPDDPTRNGLYPSAPDPADEAIANVDRAGYVHAVRVAIDAVAVLREGDPDPYRCAFHPGAKCRHAPRGARPAACRQRPLVLQVLHDALRAQHLEAPTLIRERLAASGVRADRVAEQCLDWFAYLLLRVPPTAPAPPPMLAAVARRLNGTGGAEPSSATVCLIMNDHPDIRIPEDLERRYAPVHRDGAPT